jgi:hypothetical protein
MRSQVMGVSVWDFGSFTNPLFPDSWRGWLQKKQMERGC